MIKKKKQEDQKERPRIIVLSGPNDEQFNWMSDGWYAEDQRDTPEAKRLFKKAKKAVEAAANVTEAIELLKKAGFDVVQDPTPPDPPDPPVHPRVIRMSEARLNDLCYLGLKVTFFQPVMNAGPRQADIRICMDMSVPERIKSPMQAILRPNERAGTSHDIFYEVDTENVKKQIVEYIEDHWMKAEFPPEGKEWIEEVWPQIVDAIMKTPEELCGVDHPIPEGGEELQ